MRKKKVLVHGTAESLQKFFADAVSRDFEIIGVLGDDKISVQGLEVFTPQNFPNVLLRLVDGIVSTTAAAHENLTKFFIERGFAPRKIFLWDAAQGWQFFGLQDEDTPTIYFCGLEFHIRDADDEKFFNRTLRRLQHQWQIKNLPPQMYPAALDQSFRAIQKRPLDLNNPKTFTEKLQWIKIFDATPIKSRLADKYFVRGWVAQKIGDEYLIPLLGAWDDFDDIDFDALPDQFVLKCNHGSGMNIICRDKKTFDRQRAREKLNAWLDFDFATWFLELHYTRIDRKIIAEKFIENMASGVIDYKFHCFNGTPKFIQVIGDRDFARHTRHQKFCDLDYNDIGAMFEDHPHFPYEVPKPKEFEKMKRFAELLSKDFSYVRVDFYEIDGKLLFGEMTFTSDAGYLPHKRTWTYEKDSEVGNFLTLPPITPPHSLLILLLIIAFAKNLCTK